MSAIDIQVLSNATVIAGADMGATGAASGLVQTPIKFGGQTAVDIVSFIRALGPKSFNRITKTKTVTFTVNHTHASFVDALRWAGSHDDTLPGVADFTLIYVDPSAVTVTLSSVNAAWTATTSIPDGAATSTDYTVTCGPFTIVSSADPAPWYARALFGGTEFSTVTRLIHGGSAADTHLDPDRQWFGGTAADHP